MQYLTVGDLIRLHKKATYTDATEEEPIFDFGRLESAVLRPQQSAGGQDAYPDAHRKAAALLHSICRNHPFHDGNKRTAVMAVIVFYGLNGWWIDVEVGELVGLAVDVAEGIRDVDDISGILKSWTTTIEIPPDHELPRE